jgi:multidrug efflux pump subunit AcrA (membrane-fusion protein)
MSGENIDLNPTVQSVSEEEEVHSPQKPQGILEKPSTPRWRRFLVPGVVGLLVLGGLGWIVFNRVVVPILAFSQMKFEPTPVPLSNPKSAKVEESSDYAASLDSRESVILQPRVSGQVTAIYVKAGDRVQADDPMLQIDAREQQAQVASRRAAVETAAANVDAARATVAKEQDSLRAEQARRAAAISNVKLAEWEYERYQELARQGAESRQLAEQKLNALRTAQATLRQVEADIRAQQAAVNQARATVNSNQRALQQAQANLSEGTALLQNYTIKAPFAGIVGDIPVKVGDFVNSSTQLLNLTQNRQLEVRIQVPLERAPELRVGLPVKLLDDQNRVLKIGQISFIAPNVDASTQSVEARAVFANAVGLRTSQFVRARVVWETRPGVLVPTSAISRLGGRDFIFVAAPLKDSGCKEPASSGFGPPPKPDPEMLVAAQKPIKLGKIVGNDQEVLEGLTASDRIVTSGILQLQNCLPIAEAPHSPPSP